MNIAIAFISSFAFIAFRTVNIKAVSSHNILYAFLSSLMTGILSLANIYIGVSAIINQNWMAAGAYVLGGAIATVVVMKYKENY